MCIRDSTGTPNNVELLLSQLKKLDGIIITHTHFDHIGSAYDLQVRLKCPVYVHKGDFPYLMREKKFKYSGMLGKVANLAERINKVKKPYNVKLIDELNADFEVIHTPGHTPGSICILYNECLICGDLLRYGKRYYIFGKEEIRLSPKSFCSDYKAYLSSVVSISNLDFDVILPGHGLPIYGAKEKLEFVKKLV